MGTGLPDFFSRTWSTLTMKFIDLQDAPISYAAAANKNVRVNVTETEVEFGGAYLEYGLIAAIGAAGRVGRMYWATDTKVLYRDDGVDWVEILRGEAVSRLASLAEKAHASLSGVSADQHHTESHKTRHQDGGADEISVTGLSGVLTENQHFGGSEAINLIYPVGSIYISVVATNPGTLFGVGTWVAFGAGRVLVGLDAGQTEFDVVEETGGAKTVDIAHTHSTPALSHSYGAADTGPTTAPEWPIIAAHGAGTTGGMSANNPHNNLQPYIVVYMWKRTA